MHVTSLDGVSLGEELLGLLRSSGSSCQLVIERFYLPFSSQGAVEFVAYSNTASYVSCYNYILNVYQLCISNYDTPLVHLRRRHDSRESKDVKRFGGGVDLYLTRRFELPACSRAVGF